MQVDTIYKVIPCISDPWKLRVILYLDEMPDLQMFARHLEGRYAERLGVVMVRSGRRELSFFLKKSRLFLLHYLKIYAIILAR